MTDEITDPTLVVRYQSDKELDMTLHFKCIGRSESVRVLVLYKVGQDVGAVVRHIQEALTRAGEVVDEQALYKSVLAKHVALWEASKTGEGGK